MDRRPTDTANLLDRAAIMLSGLCMLHCLALPIVLIAVPMLEPIVSGHFHLQMLAIVVPVSTVAFAIGLLRHRHPGMLAWGVVGMLLLLIGGTWAHNEVGIVADRAFTISGALILAAAHYTNSRLTKQHRRAVKRQAAEA